MLSRETRRASRLPLRTREHRDLGSVPVFRTSLEMDKLLPLPWMNLCFVSELKHVQSELMKFSNVNVIVFTSWNKTGIKRHVFLNLSPVTVPIWNRFKR